MLNERSLSGGEKKEKERVVKGMKKSFSDFRKRYGKDAKSVMYATATKMAKEGAYDKFDRRVKAAGAAKSDDAKLKILKSAIPLRPKLAEETLDEALPLVVSGGLAVTKMAAKQAVKKGAQKVKDKVSDVLSKKEEPKEEPKKPEGEDKKKTTYKSSGEGIKQTAEVGKKAVRRVAGGLASMYQPRESYTFEDFRKIASQYISEAQPPIQPATGWFPGRGGPIHPGGRPYQGRPSGSTYKMVKKKPTTQMAHYEPEGEQIDEFNIIQKAMDVVDKVNRTQQKKVDIINKIRPGSATMPKHGYFTPQKKTNESAAWTRKAGKNSEGGLNEKGRKSYERENPGSDLKAPSKKVGNPRRASFCARMSGMKKKLTSKKTANDPNSRINKSLRAWNC